MFKNKCADGKVNLCGEKLAKLRTGRNMSQRLLADMMQLEGLDIGKNMIQRIECGKRFVTDIELKAFAKYFGITMDELVE